jgi:hypothetical protein
MRALATAAVLACLVGSAPGVATASAQVKQTLNPTVLMDPVAMPVVVDGQLVNYVFVTIRLGLSADADPVKLRAMEPYFRDALVRVGHRTPFVRSDNYTKLDDDKLKAALLHEAAAIAGPGKVLSAQIIREQAQHYDGLPKPSAPAR